jgi:hypothetical protein
MEKIEVTSVDNIFREIFEECEKVVDCLKYETNNKVSTEDMIAMSENIKKQVVMQFNIVMLSVDYYFVHEILKIKKNDQFDQKT